MSYLVNGQIVTELIIQEEMERITRTPAWQGKEDSSERRRKLRVDAEGAAIDRVLIEQLAMADCRPIDPSSLDREVERMNGKRELKN